MFLLAAAVAYSPLSQTHHEMPSKPPPLCSRNSSSSWWSRLITPDITVTHCICLLNLKHEECYSVSWGGSIFLGTQYSILAESKLVGTGNTNSTSGSLGVLVRKANPTSPHKFPNLCIPDQYHTIYMPLVQYINLVLENRCPSTSWNIPWAGT